MWGSTRTQLFVTEPEAQGEALGGRWGQQGQLSGACGVGCGPFRLGRAGPRGGRKQSLSKGVEVGRAGVLGDAG